MSVSSPMSGNTTTCDRSPMVKTSIFLYVVCGFWCPMWWSSKWKYGYRFFSIFMRFVLATWMLSQVFEIVLNINDVTEMSTNFMSLIPGINSSCKAANVLVHRRNIIALLKMLEDNYCKVQNSREVDIQRKYEKMHRWLTPSTIALAITTAICVLLYPFLINGNVRVLPLLTWSPYTVDSELTFWSSYIYQSVLGTMVTLLSLANDLLVISIMMQISGQLDVLSHRFVHLAESNKIRTRKHRISWIEEYATLSGQRAEIKKELKNNVRHHRFIFKLGETTQRCFVVTFGTQMLASLIGSCTNAYLFSRVSFGSPDFNRAGLLFSCMIVEAFLYCWFANEVRLKSLEIADAVYNSDWTNLCISLRKDLLNVSIRSRSRPILFTSGPALALSNVVFVGILKASYTAFTVLQRAGVASSSNAAPAGK